MKSTQLLKVAFLLVLSTTIYSCSNTHDFAGVYPKNNITGKGFGGHADNSNQHATDTQTVNSVVANTDDYCVADAPKVKADDPTLTALASTNGKPLTKGQKFGIKLDNFLLKQVGVNDITKFSAPEYFAQHKGAFSWREKLGNKIYTKVYNKYAARQSADLGGASGPLGIVSLVFGLVALFAWYGSFLFGVIAIVTGALSIAGGARRPIMAILGIIFGILAIIGWGIIFGVHVVIF